MEQPTNIRINDTEYVRADAAAKTDGDIKIVVLDRAYIYIGRVRIDGDFVRITNAKNIRVWGTTKGLGELVHGPTSTTKLDAAGDISAPLRALIFTMAVEQAKWSVI